jgi:hypothetical protein
MRIRWRVDRIMTRRGHLALAVLLTVIALSLVACSDDDAADPAQAAPESPTPDEVDPSEPGPVARDDAQMEADRQIAERANLRLDDFPPGWQERVMDDEEDEEGQARIAECAGYAVEELYGGVRERADSPTFVSSQDQEISSSVTVFPTDQEAGRRFDAITDPGTIDCIADEMRGMIALEAAREGLEVLGLEINRLSTSNFGDETFGYRIVVELSSRGMSVSGYFDVVGVRVGRAGATVQAFSMFGPFFIQDLEGYVETVVSRIDIDEAE